MRRHCRSLCVGLALGCGVSSLLPVCAQTNLGFEDGVDAGSTVRVRGWEVDDEALVAIDASTIRSGDRSLRIAAAQGDGRARFAQSIDARALGGDRLRVSAYVRTPSPSAAGLRIRVDGDRGLLYISRNARERNSDTSGWSLIEIEAPLDETARRVEFGGEVAAGSSAWFDDFRIETLLARELPAPSTIAERYVEQALEIIEEHAVARSTLDWPAYRAAVMVQARGAVSTSDAHLAVQYALAKLADGHSYFMTPRQMETLAERPVGNARTARAPVAPRASVLEGAIGYLYLPGIAGGEHIARVEFAESVQALIAAHDAAANCGWILDLRDNQGGNAWPMLAGVGPLLGDGELASSVQPGGERRALWYDDGKAGFGDFVQLRVRGDAYRLQRGTAPVAVLVNDETASAAEIVALGFVGRSHTRSFGAATDGAGTATRTFTMSDGAALMLVIASLADRHGRVLVGPIVPDETVDDKARGEALATQPIVVAATRWLRSEARCETDGGTPLAP